MQPRDVISADPVSPAVRSGADGRAGEPLFDGARFDAVLFDLDGTLADSTASVLRCWIRWAGEYEVPLEQLQGRHGVTAKQILAAVIADPARRADGLARIEQLEIDDAAAGIPAIDGAVAALAALPPGRAAIVTSSTRPLALARIAAAGLVAPPVVVTADEVVVGKPDPEPFRLGAELLGVDPARCLVVEDAPAGLASGRAAGARTLGLATTHVAAELDADVLVGTLAEVRFVDGPDGVHVVRGPAL